ncbi:hypothetical protein [Pseudomonas corrugata]
MMKYYVSVSGVYLGGWEDFPPDEAIEINPPPEYSDQVWQFPGWSESVSAVVNREVEWRDAEMPKAQQNVTAIEYGEEGIPGTAAQWKVYWLSLRKWTEANPDFPDATKRPVRPA